MIHNIDQPQENSKKLTMPILNGKLQKIISRYFIYNITNEITNKTNPEIYSKLNYSIVISICYYKEAEYNSFIIVFENTILKIQESSISFIGNLLSSNSNLIFNFSPNTKCIFDNCITLNYKESDVFLECSNINEYIQSTKENELNISILRCILQYLFQKSYIKLNQKNRINDLYINETKPKLFNEVEYIKIAKFFSGSVFRVQLNYLIESEELFILKEPTNTTEDFPYLINREEKIYKLLNHPLLPKFYGKINNYLAIEYINGKSLFYIKELKLSYNEKIKIIYEIMILISYFHKNELILRDLKPDNIIIDHNKTAVFIDFDRVISFDDESNTNEFSFYFSAPETQSGNVTYKSDIYSLGMIIYYIMIEENPTENNIIKFNDFGQCSIIKKIFSNCIKEDPKERNNIMSILDIFLGNCASLIQPDDLMNINNIFVEFDYLKDDPRKEFKLGNLFLHSKDITKYINKVVHYFTLASNKNDPEAQYNLGVIYYEGKYVTRDVDKAINYLNMALNFAPAQFFLGFIYNKTDINKAIYYYSLSAKQNYAQAQLSLGVIYYEGKYVTRDISKGIHYFGLAANQNNLQAQINLGLIYFEGNFINRDINKAIHYFTLAADNNDPQSQFNLGLIFYEGKFIKRNIDKSIYYFSLAAYQDNSNAQFELGLIYYNGQYVQRDINKSIQYLLLSANQNHPDALFLLGIIYFNDDYIPRNIEKSIHYFELAAKQNNLKAQINCGLIYYEGCYTKQNINKSIYYYTLAANQNCIIAIRNLGFIYLKIDIKKSIDYYKFAADQNDVISIYNLSLIYYNGDYVNRDIDLAIHYFQLAANQNYDKAQFHLGLIYFENKYVTRDIDKAVYYFTLAANQNNSSAQNNLGYIYQSGEFVPRDINKAIYYFILSANQDNPYAQYSLGYMFFEGKYVQIDINKSFHFFKLSSLQNFAPAQFYLGIFYLTGFCVDKDINKALNYLLSSPENKDFAMFEIGYFYLEGKYFEKNIDNSITYFKEASTLENQFAQNNLGIIYKNIKNEIGKAIDYFENAIRKYKDSLSMYNLAHLYIYEDKTTERISKSITYLIDLSSNNFQYADDLLCIALIKKYGFDIENIKKNIDNVPDRIYLMINDESVFEEQYKYYKTVDFLYNHLLKPIQSKSIINQNQTEINNEKLTKITSDFYDGFNL